MKSPLTFLKLKAPSLSNLKKWALVHITEILLLVAVIALLIGKIISIKSHQNPKNEIDLRYDHGPTPYEKFLESEDKEFPYK